MRCAAMFVAGALTLTIALPVRAQESEVRGAECWVRGAACAVPPANLFEEKKPAFKPYIVDWGVRPSADRTSPPQPTVVCGMTLVPADPKIDPKMPIAMPQSGVDFTMRVAPPTLCKAG